MDCLRSFVLTIDQAGTFTGSDVKTWASGTDAYFLCNLRGALTKSTFNIAGFKNINIYGMDVIGQVTTQIDAATGGCLVTDWAFEVVLNGQIPQINGDVTLSPNYWAINPTDPDVKSFSLSKYTPSVKFASPFQSVTSINFDAITVQGYGNQTALTVSLDWDLSFVFYYKYEGE